METFLTDGIKHIYFLGIGGIGMSALARYFKANGSYGLAGYDRTPSVLTEKMRLEEGIVITYQDMVETIPSDFRNPRTTLVIYTPAVPQDNCQMTFFREHGFKFYKRAEVLGWISRKKRAICVAGTHGKTTVSTMTAFLLHHSTLKCTAFLGGVSVNFASNLLLEKDSPYVVIEADEFDRSFLHLTPEWAVITSIDNDHLDIYHDREHLIEAFEAFGQKVLPSGALFLKEGLILKHSRVTASYGVETGKCRAEHLRIKNGFYAFDYHGRNVDIEDLQLGVPGRLNVENAVAAITLALEVGVQPEEIRIALPLFKGVQRRFTIHVNENGYIYIDDYAHHPREIEATLRSVREMWKAKKMTVVFQPHLYSRTKDFYLDFARSLSLADEVILLDIYPARELPMEGVSSELIKKHLTIPGQILSKEELIDYLKKHFEPGVLITMGAGDIDRLTGEITEVLKNRK